MQSLYHTNFGLWSAASDHDRKVFDSIDLLVGEAIELLASHNSVRTMSISQYAN
jgi:hypothetical protein